MFVGMLVGAGSVVFLIDVHLALRVDHPRLHQKSLKTGPCVQNLDLLVDPYL